MTDTGTGTQYGQQTGGNATMQSGDDYVCSNCGSEVMVKHPGDDAKALPANTFTCRCGTRMEPEHPNG
jgi:DNA-directed RNA polymerase subunit RPC12/RpoP